MEAFVACRKSMSTLMGMEKPDEEPDREVGRKRVERLHKLRNLSLHVTRRIQFYDFSRFSGFVCFKCNCHTVLVLILVFLKARFLKLKGSSIRGRKPSSQGVG